MRIRLFTALLTTSLLGVLPGASSTAATAPQISWTKDLKVIGSVSVAPSGDLYFIGADAKLHHTDSRGVEKWNFTFGDIGRAEPIVLPGGGVIAGSYDDTLYSIDPSGKLVWKTKLDGDIYATRRCGPTGASSPRRRAAACTPSTRAAASCGSTGRPARSSAVRLWT